MHTADPLNQASGRTSSPSWLLPAGPGSVLGPVTSQAPHQATPQLLYLDAAQPGSHSCLCSASRGAGRTDGELWQVRKGKKKIKPPGESDKADPSPRVSLSNLFSGRMKTREWAEVGGAPTDKDKPRAEFRCVPSRCHSPAGGRS